MEIDNVGDEDKDENVEEVNDNEFCFGLIDDLFFKVYFFDLKYDLMRRSKVIFGFDCFFYLF